MKKIKATLCMIMAVSMLLSLCACSGSNSGGTNSGGSAAASSSSNAAPDKPTYTDTYNIVYATPDAQGSSFDKNFITPFIEKVETYSNGRITVEPYYSSTLAGQGAVLSAIDKGSADAGGDSPTMYTGMYLYSELINAPGIDYSSEGNYTRVLNDYAKAFPDKGLEKYYVIARYSAGTFGFCTTKKVIETPDSSKGLTFRATGNLIPYVEALGASGTFIPLSELYESLRLNVVDGAITTIDRIAADSYYDICDYFTQITWFMGDHIEALSMDYYNKMDPEAQAAIDKASAEMQENVVDWLDDAFSSSKQACKDGNPDFKYIVLEGDKLDYYVNAAAGVLQKKVDELNAAGLDGDGAVAWLKENAKKYA